MNARLDTPAGVRDETVTWHAGARPVPAGPRAYRARIRTLGPFLALTPPALLGMLAWLMLRHNESVNRGIGGFVAAMFAAPLLPVAGAPLRAGDGPYVLAGMVSALVWLVLGLVASRRATRTPAATWRDFWIEWAWLAAGVWAGVMLSLVASNLVLGRALL